MSFFLPPNVFILINILHNMVFLHECYKLNSLNYICYSMKFHDFYAVSYKWYACIINMERAFHTNRTLVPLTSDGLILNTIIIPVLKYSIAIYIIQ